jgi:tetratricopeptide (TPR) repeat protein
VAGSLPLGLRSALEAGECVLFIGAGIGCYLNIGSKNAPSGPELAHELIDQFKLEVDSGDLAKVARLVEIRRSRSDLEAYLSKRLGNAEPNEILGWLPLMRWRAIFTTNYDQGIERAYALCAKPSQTPISISTTSQIIEYDHRFEVPIYHVHGKIQDEGGGQIVITSEDYTRFSERRSMLFEILKQKFATSTFLYVGYSNKDPNWQMLYSELKREFEPSPLPRSFRIDPFTDDMDREILAADGLDTISDTFENFVHSAREELAGVEIDQGRLERVRKSVPSQLSAAFEQSPAAVARLLNSWTYVNQAPFKETPNTKLFLKGDRANWGLISSNGYFQRDLEAELNDILLDYATAGLHRPQSALLLGSAGYGITTLMRALAVKYVKEKAGPVFYHREGSPILEGDIEFATTLFPTQAPLFVVDDAADFTKELTQSTAVLRELRRQSFILLGARRNEWLQTRSRVPGKSYDLEALSGDEVGRVLDFLSSNGSLNRLEGLSREHQVSAIQQRHGKELLVVMREATEDQGFDAIIEDEFRGIESDAARKMYLAVCCVNQHGGVVRDEVLAKVLGKDLAGLYGEVTGTEGVVIFDELDPASNLFFARARHRTIAAIVWERCGDAGTRAALTRDLLDALNLNFGVDVKAFDQMVRSDRLVDGLRTLEDRIKFFDSACRKDPTSPYVRQHYARMFVRAEKPDLALGQIEKGLELTDDAPRVLYHTKGVILSRLADSIESVELARKRMAQSESAFRKVLSMNSRDAYAYQGLAELYLAWAKRSENDDERASYLAKSEEVISHGLKEVRDKDGLWIVSSEVEDFVGNDPKQLLALEKAVRDAPESVVARYLLARKYRSDGNADKAIMVLEPVIQGYPDEFRCYREYALALLQTGEPLLKCVNMLRLSSLYGMSDSRYLATLAGLYFLDKQFGEAEKIFGEGLRKELPARDLNVVRFRPGLEGFESRLAGTVGQVGAGFSMLSVPGFPRIFCSASKYGGVVLRVGMRVHFDLVFSAKSAAAENLQISPRP